MNYEIVFSDVDGTLLNQTSSVTGHTVSNKITSTAGHPVCYHIRKKSLWNLSYTRKIRV